MQIDAEYDGAEMMAMAILAAERATLTSDAGLAATPADGWERIGGSSCRAGEPSRGRLARIRKQVDSLLAQMLADESDHDYDHDHGVRLAEADIPDADTSAPEAGDTEGPGGSAQEEGFWGPGEASDAIPAAGYQSKHRRAGTSREAGPGNGGRGKPRHAAPPASVMAVVGRRLASLRPTGHYAAHAA